MPDWPEDPGETKMILIVNSEAIPVTYREAERIYDRLSEVFDTAIVKEIKDKLHNGRVKA